MLKHIDDLLGKKATRQTKRLRYNLRIRSDRRNGTIRIASRPAFFSMFARELNWLTYPEIGVLEMMDDQLENGTKYTCFRIVDKLSHGDIGELTQKLWHYHANRRAKLNFVFNRFLTAKPGEAKAVILDYLDLEQKPLRKSESARRIRTAGPLNFKQDINRRNYHAWVLLNEEGDKAYAVPVKKGYVVVNGKGEVMAKAKTISQARNRLDSMVEY